MHEAELFERFQSRLNITPGPIEPVRDPNRFVWDIVLESHQLVPKILQADKEAIAGRTVYDNDYFEKFFGGIRSVLEQQLSRAPYPYPELRLRRRPPSIFDYGPEDFEILDYRHHPAIKAPVAV